MANRPERVEALNAMLREDARRQRLGPEARCALCPPGCQCGCDESAALERRELILCYEHAAPLDGRSRIEQHHIPSRALSAETIALPGNWHRDASDRQLDWPAVLRTAHDPLAVIAAAIRAIGELCAWVARHAEAWSDYLLRLRDALIAHFGESWESQLGLVG